MRQLIELLEILLWVDKSRGLQFVIYCYFTDEPGKKNEGKPGEGSNETDLGSQDTSKASKRY